MTRKENYLKAVHFDRPDYIPTTFHINVASFDHYDRDTLYELMENHKMLFPNFKKPTEYKPVYGNCAIKDKPYTDDFGCVWKTTVDGIVGTVVEHPLADWDNFKNYKAPNPEICTGVGPIDWKKVKERFEANPDALRVGALRHGHTFLQLTDIRGFEGLIFDMVDEEPKLWELIELIENFNYGIIKRYIDLKVDMMSYAEDLGMQVGPMISPVHFKKYIVPSYERLIKPAKDAGIAIHMHSDGDIRTLVDDIVGSGVDVINLQDLVNGIDWIANRFAGKTCVDLDIDRQNITVFGGKKEINEHIKECVTKIASKEGGMMMVYGLYPGVPMENVKHIMDAMEDYMCYFS